jgi:hypothetical protein
MVTRAKAGIRCPNPKYALATTATPAPPALPPAQLRDPAWTAAMQDEFEALQRNRTWTLVDRPHGGRVLSGKWVFKYKLRSDGTPERHKARWVLRGDRQRPGIDLGETFTPVVKPATIRVVLTLFASKKWPANQLDVSNAFLHGQLHEKVYCQQSVGFVDPDQPDAVCLLDRYLYGLRQAPRAWFTSFTDYVKHIGFVQTRSDSSLFLLRDSTGVVAYLLLYVDDMVLAAKTPALLHASIKKLQSAFAVKDMGALAYFLGVDVRRTTEGFFLSQEQYVDDLLEHAGMKNCKAAADASFFRSIAGVLQYLTLTRPDIAYAVQQLCLHMHAPHDIHVAMLKRVLRYIKGTPQIGIQLRAMTSPTLTAYSDADWPGCPDTRRSTSGFCVFLGDALVSWSSKRQTTVSRSRVQAQELSTAAWRTPSPSARGCVLSSAISAVRCLPRQSSYVTTSPLST